MSEIMRLDTATASKIAAGEVVERPVNVVKELLENALDAESTRIHVEVAGGGVELIRITDNGKGIRYSELPLAVERFATSKARTVEDVYNISTFGFRGEALAAVSSVSRFSLKSVRTGDEAGELTVLYGDSHTVKPAAISKGTQVSVAELFENIPVRKNFLKSARANEGEILRFIKQFSVINHGLELILDFDGQEVYRVYPSSDMIDVAKAVFDEDRVSYARYNFDGGSIDICLTSPVVQRKRKDSIYIGVNGRVIKEPSLVQAVIMAYHRVIPSDSYPMAAVDIRINPSFVDVNVHPTKQEVRFAEPSFLFSQVKTASEKALAGFTAAVYAEEDEQLNDNMLETSKPKVSELRLDDNMRKAPFYKAAPAFDLSKHMKSAQVQMQTSLPAQSGDSDLYIHDDAERKCKVIGQLSDMYIVCSGKDGELIVIDQHVAHERVLYEKYRNNRNNVLPSVSLFEPLVMHFSQDEHEYLLSVAGDMARFGYVYEIFGTGGIKIVRVPVDILKKNIENEFKMLVNDVLQQRGSKREDAAIVMMSCRNAVKAGDPLTVYEMQHLVDALFKTENPHTCPHGRPIIFSMSSAELGKKFHR